MFRGKENSFSSLGWLVGQRTVRYGGRWLGTRGQGAVGKAAPVFQQQGPQHVGSVLGLDLVRDDHLLHHLVGHTGQGLLVQVQEHGPWKDSTGGSSSPAEKVQGQRESQGQGGSQLSMAQGTVSMA